MELIMKAAAVALIAGMMGLLIKRSNPEISLLLSAAAVTLIGIAAMSFAGEIKGLVKTVKTLCGTSDVFLTPVLKCTAVAIITKLTAELCRDASQGACAAAVELAGTVCAMCLAMPLIMNMLKMMGGMV